MPPLKIKADAGPVPEAEIGLKRGPLKLAPVPVPAPEGSAQPKPMALPAIKAPHPQPALAPMPVTLAKTPPPRPVAGLEPADVKLAPVLAPRPGVTALPKDVAFGPIGAPSPSLPVKPLDLKLAPTLSPRIDVPVKDFGTSFPVGVPQPKIPTKSVDLALGPVIAPTVDLAVKTAPHRPVLTIAVPKISVLVPPVMPQIPRKTVSESKKIVVVRERERSSKNIFVRGGNTYVTVINRLPDCLGALDVDTGPVKGLSCRPQEVQRTCFERSLLRKYGPGDKTVVLPAGDRPIRAVCVDDKGLSHPASRLSPAERVSETYEGELYRCVVGTRLEVEVADATGAFGAERLSCQKGEALWYGTLEPGLTLASGGGGFCLTGGVGEGY
ncbi:MAG: hypothetical protein HXY25_07640 [Alphaproteobacteria bacterium]|nr:hypothetical protein [Alphaproteobacteria bacterium]